MLMPVQASPRGKEEERSALVAAGRPKTTLLHTPAWAKETFWPPTLHITVSYWIWGSHDQEKDSTMGCRGNLVPRWSLSRVAVAVVGI